MFSDILGLYEQSIERAAREARVGQSRRDILVAVRQDFGGKITNELLFEALGGMIGREELVEDADGTLHLIGESEPGCHKRARPSSAVHSCSEFRGGALF